MLVKFFLQKTEDFFLDFPSTLCTPSIRPPLLRLTFHVSLYRALDGDLLILLNQLHVNVYGKRKDKTSLICQKFSNIIVALVNVDLLNMLLVNYWINPRTEENHGELLVNKFVHSQECSSV